MTQLKPPRWFYSVLILCQLLKITSSFVVGSPPRCNGQCAFEYIPVCGSDGRTYPNVCFLYVASCRDTSLTYLRPGPCRLPDPCDIPCNRKYEPVCGNDGVTYTNPCILMYESCINPDRGITMAYRGRCRGSTPEDGNSLLPRPSPPLPNPFPPVVGLRPRCPFGCSREYLPVCGSDGVTYSNECTFNTVACRDSSLRKVKDDACGNEIVLPANPRCPLGCNKVYEPVCGSDDVTYINNCHFSRASCANPSITKIKEEECFPSRTTTPTTRRPLFPLGPFTPTSPSSPFSKPSDPVTTADIDMSNREFCRKDCPFNYNPVCGTDGVTYTNKCTFDVAICVDSSLKIDYNGSCNRF